jgi:hypothetical protein
VCVNLEHGFDFDFHRRRTWFRVGLGATFCILYGASEPALSVGGCVFPRPSRPIFITVGHLTTLNVHLEGPQLPQSFHYSTSAWLNLP